MWLDRTAATCTLIRNQGKFNSCRSLVVAYRDLFVLNIVIESRVVLSYGPSRHAQGRGCPSVRLRGGTTPFGTKAVFHIFSSLSPLRRAFGRRLLQRRTPRPTSGQARPRRRSCRASSTTCTAGSGGNPLASPPKSPDGRAA